MSEGEELEPPEGWFDENDLLRESLTHAFAVCALALLCLVASGAWLAFAIGTERAACEPPNVTDVRDVQACQKRRQADSASARLQRAPVAPALWGVILGAAAVMFGGALWASLGFSLPVGDAARLWCVRAVLVLALASAACALFATARAVSAAHRSDAFVSTLVN